MKTTLEHATLTIESGPDDKWSGEVEARAIATHPKHGRMLRCTGEVRVDGKWTPLSIRLDDKPELSELVELWLAATTEAEAEQLEAEAENRRRLESGEELITLSYCDGEYLSGYTCSGHAATLLERLGLGHSVSNWGFSVDRKVTEALGAEFAYPDAAELARPAIEAKAQKTAKADADRQAKFNEAASTGQQVVLGTFAVGCDGSVDECSIDIITQYALPNGTTCSDRVHTH